MDMVLPNETEITRGTAGPKICRLPERQEQALINEEYAIYLKWLRRRDNKKGRFHAKNNI